VQREWNVRFGPTFALHQRMSALPPIADIRHREWNGF
jgi:hypothetical protein